jgi:hypothetical protein
LLAGENPKNGGATVGDRRRARNLDDAPRRAAPRRAAPRVEDLPAAAAGGRFLWSGGATR